MVLDEMMMERTISVKTELLSSSEMTESMEMASDESKESEEDGSSALPRGMELDSRGMELDCSSCLLQEQMKEGNYELVSKVATFCFCLSHRTNVINRCFIVQWRISDDDGEYGEDAW